MKSRHGRSSGTATGVAILIAALALGSTCGGGDRRAVERPVIGVKIYEASPPFEGLFRQWRDLGINTAFVSEALARNDEFRALARSRAIALFVIFPVFQNPETIKEHPGLAAVTAEGNAAHDDWVEFVCPSRDDYVGGLAGRLEDLVAACDPDAVSIDFIRFFVFWEMVYPERTAGSLPQTCFCPVCLDRFSAEMGVAIPARLATTPEKADWILKSHADEWTEWKCRVIARAVERLAKAARRVKPGVKVNLHAVPWREADFGGAVKSVAGQDLARLAPLVDIISPMAYHHMVKQTPAWIHSVVDDISRRTGGTVLASTQVSRAYIEADLPSAEFRASLEEALKPPSIGVVLWSWDALAKSPEKMEILKSLARPDQRP